MFYTNFDTMNSQLSMASDPSFAQVASSSSRSVYATLHFQDQYGRNTSKRWSLVVSADTSWEDWILSFEEIAVQVGKEFGFRDVAIAFRTDGMEKEPTFWEYLQNFLRPVFGQRYVDMPTW